MNWWQYAIIAALVFGAYMLVDHRGHERGVSQTKTYYDETVVPAAQKAVQDKCDENAKLTESANAKDFADKDAARSRAERQLEQLRKTYTAIPCVPVTDLASVYNARTNAVRPAGPGGVDARDLVILGEQCRTRSDEFLNARQFILETWANHDKGRNAR